MRIRVDREADALCFRLDERRIVDSEEVRPGVVLDFDEHDRVVGVEFRGGGVDVASVLHEVAAPDTLHPGIRARGVAHPRVFGSFREDETAPPNCPQPAMMEAPRAARTV